MSKKGMEKAANLWWMNGEEVVEQGLKSLPKVAGVSERLQGEVTPKLVEHLKQALPPGAKPEAVVMLLSRLMMEKCPQVVVGTGKRVMAGQAREIVGDVFDQGPKASAGNGSGSKPPMDPLEPPKTKESPTHNADQSHSDGKNQNGSMLEGPRYGDRKISKDRYKELRGTTPSKAMQRKVNEGIHFPIEDPVLPGKIVTAYQADHIVSMDKITRMDGFEKLTFKQQVEVLNNPDNFMGLSESANKSKQQKSYSEWTHYKKGTSEEIDKNFRAKMIKREQELEIQLQKQIDDMIRKNNGG